MIVISEALALALIDQPTADHPVIGWRNLVTIENITASSEQAAYPASNLANPSTTSLQGWRSNSTALQYVTVDLQATEEVDYVGVARHNFGSAQISVTVQGTTDGSTWFDLVEEFMPANDESLLLRFVEQGLLQVRLRLLPAATAPRAAVLYAGALLVMERGLQPHTPIGMGRQRSKATGEAESGDYLGTIVTTSRLATAVQINLLSAEWVREELDAFCNYASYGQPFFFAWQPATYPDEVGYVWAPGDVQPTAANLVGHMNLSLNLAGIA